MFDASTIHVSSDDLIAARLLISEIRDKKEIVDKLQGLGANIGVLRAAVLTNDSEKTSKLVKDITTNEYFGISAIITDLNILKKKVEELDRLHDSILHRSKSIDANTNLHSDFQEKHKQVAKCHEQQKNVFLNLSFLFIEMSKQFMKRDSKKK